MHPTIMKLAFDLFPPYWGTGIKVRSISRDYRRLSVEMPLRWFNKNVKGTHFGGNLFSMTDPFYMIMLIKVLGKGYDVWDQQSDIHFLRPGKGLVKANFALSKAFTDDIIKNTRNGAKTSPQFVINITDEAGEIVATVTKSIYIRKRNSHASMQEKRNELAA